MGGLFALLLPGVYFLLKFALALPACVVDDLGTADALRRNFVTTGKYVFLIAGLLTSFVLVMFLASVAVTLVLGGGVGNGFVGQLVQNLVTAVAVPLYGLAFGRLYPADSAAPG